MSSKLLPSAFLCNDCKLVANNLGSCPILVINTGTRFKAEGRGQRAAMLKEEKERRKDGRKK